MKSRRWLVPELVQTSGMDCGPAALTALLEGHHVHASYGRLREACQTEVDGTSIDTLEEVLVRLGLDAEQKLLPADHLIRPDAGALPALVVVVLPNGFTHFVVLWRVHGPVVQVMDPASGRRWMTRTAFVRELFIHEMPVPAEAFLEFAQSEEFTRPLVGRLAEIGLGDGARRVAEASGPAVGVLDAAVRMTSELVKAGAVKRGAESGALCEALYRRALEDRETIPERYWFVRPDAEDPEQVILRGVVAVAVRGQRSQGEEGRAELPRELAAALAEPPFRPWQTLAARVRQVNGPRIVLVLLMMVLASFSTLFEAFVLRGLIDLTSFLHAREQRVAALIAVIALFAAVFGVDWKLLDLVQRVGRSLEIDLRIAFLSKVPRLGLRYFRSRPASDLASRIHEAHRIRGVPDTLSEVIRDALGIFAILVGIGWVDPKSLLPAACVAATSVVLPALLQPGVSERELRMRIHSGAMLHSNADALLGMMPLRAHVGERSVRREHEQILSEWARCGYRLLRLATAGEAIVGLVRVVCLTWLLLSFLRRPGDQHAMLLVTYWVVYMGTLGRRLVVAVRQLAPLQNVTGRLLEPLGAPEDPALAPAVAAKLGLAAAAGESDAGMTIALDGVGLSAGGHTVLADVELRIASGEHVAIVGQSGGGKTSLVSLVLGLVRPTSGTVRVDGSPMTAETRELRAATTVWVDPAAHLWNASLLENLLYGATTSDHVSEALDAAELLDVVERLPDGMHTSVGEGGRLLSGGQGQRVRLGRAMMRKPVRLAILDEAFRGLETDRRHALLARARARWPKATLLSVTHDVHETIAFPRVLVVEGGRIVEDGSPAELAKQEGSRYRALLEADDAMGADLWPSSRWRKVRVDGGVVEESPAR